MSKMVNISIIVPVYNAERYLKRCVDSIVAQTINDFELILVDDGSTDKSGAICDEYSSKDQRIKTVHKPNGGGIFSAELRPKSCARNICRFCGRRRLR